MKHRGPTIIFRGEHGRFVAYKDRYTNKVKRIEAFRGDGYKLLAERMLPPNKLANLLNRREFESMPEALSAIKSYTSNKKYKAWDIAEQIDKTKGIRRKSIKVTLTLDDGGRMRKIEFYHNVKRNTASSYSIFRRINQEIGLEGMFLYDRVGGKVFADRKGKQVKLLGAKVENVI